MSVNWHYVSLKSVTRRSCCVTACCVVYCRIIIVELMFLYTKDVNVSMCALFRWAKAGLLRMTALNAACVIL